VLAKDTYSYAAKRDADAYLTFYVTYLIILCTRNVFIATGAVWLWDISKKMKQNSTSAEKGKKR